MNDWKPSTEAETIAIAQSYLEYQRVNRELKIIKEEKYFRSLLNDTKARFINLETRSYHPYIRYQKGRVLRLFQINRLVNTFTQEQQTQLNSIAKTSYDDTYYSINFRHKHLMATESYGAFLWVYSIFLENMSQIQNKPDYLFKAIRILEEGVQCLSTLKKIENIITLGNANSKLAQEYGLAYLYTSDIRYLTKVRASVFEAKRIFECAHKPHLEHVQLELLLILSDVFMKNYIPTNLIRRYRNLKPIPWYLRAIENVIKSEFFKIEGIHL
ncbi:hypothetical protein [Desulfosporosinus nitroreducens]|uniref:hypothetical protein n=1 Tax=Desulfosporosinus nitroreducens TaxID=2018668 RepID=UPI00207C45ED|nr:hypothetical protein [Desulfosporosinus nitroreducens]MCO1604671.1 hypothetical protein [Desulfosporosinus nitroreducens]